MTSRIKAILMETYLWHILRCCWVTLATFCSTFLVISFQGKPRAHCLHKSQDALPLFCFHFSHLRMHCWNLLEKTALFVFARNWKFLIISQFLALLKKKENCFTLKEILALENFLRGLNSRSDTCAVYNNSFNFKI